MEKSRRCDFCNIDVHRAPYSKHFRSKKLLETIGRNELMIPEWLFKEEQASIKKKLKKYIILKL